MTVAGGFTHTTKEVVISVLCDMTSLTMTSSILAPQFYNYTQFTLNEIYFSPFTCSPAVCCLKMKYSISSTATNPPIKSLYAGRP